jgi:hypothetical protein
MRGSQRSLTRGGATPGLPACRHIRILTKFQGEMPVVYRSQNRTFFSQPWPRKFFLVACVAVICAFLSRITWYSDLESSLLPHVRLWFGKHCPLTKQKWYIIAKIVMLVWDCVVTGIKGVTGPGHAATMDGMVWRGRAHRATTGTTNTTPVPRSSAASLAANTHRGGWTTTEYEARTVDETVMPVLEEY